MRKGYQDITKHLGATYEGVLPLKIKDEVILSDWVYAIIVPEKEKEAVKGHVPKSLKSKIYYINMDAKDIWEWSEKVYYFVKNINYK